MAKRLQHVVAVEDGQIHLVQDGMGNEPVRPCLCGEALTDDDVTKETRGAAEPNAVRQSAWAQSAGDNWCMACVRTYYTEFREFDGSDSFR